MSYELTNQPGNAAEQMKKLLPWVRKNYDYDEFAERKAKRYLTLKGGLSAFDKHFHVCMLHYEACRWEETLKAITEIEPTVHAEEVSEEQCTNDTVNNWLTSLFFSSIYRTELVSCG